MEPSIATTRPNPLMDLAASDRHGDCCADNFCTVCGSHASGYNANKALLIQRPEAADCDWWVACDNADCVNAIGEDCSQIEPDWVKHERTTT